MIGLTVIAGAAVFGWVNGQAAVSENAYGQSAGGVSNFLREHFTPVTTTFSGPGGAACSGTPVVCTVAYVWIFNNGQLAFTLSSLQVQSAVGSASPLNVIYTSAGYTAYNSGGTALVCPGTPGFSFAGTNPVPTGTLSTASYHVTIPTSCSGVNSMVDGQSYVITMTGVYGNVVSFQVTVNG